MKNRRWGRCKSSELSYGEISYIEYAYIFCQLYRHGLKREGLTGKFVDIGCGAGKALFATALLHDFKWCVGIEILGSLVAVSREGSRMGDVHEHALVHA